MATGLVAVVLAGGGSDRLAVHAGAATKAAVRFGDRPLVAYVLAALARSSRVDRVVCVGCAQEPASSTADQPGGPGRERSVVHVPGGHRLVDSLALGLGAAACFSPERILIASADLPWLTSASVDAFIAEAPDADFVYPAVPRAEMERRFPGQRRTYARVSEGVLTGGNVILVRPKVVAALLPLVEKAYRSRKNPWALASLVGWDLAARLVVGKLSVAAAEKRVSALLGGSARGLISSDPTLAADIDRPEHLSLVPPNVDVVAGETR